MKAAGGGITATSATSALPQSAISRDCSSAFWPVSDPSYARRIFLYMGRQDTPRLPKRVVRMDRFRKPRRGFERWTVMTRIPFAAAALAAALFAVPAFAQTSSHHHGTTSGHPGHTRGGSVHGSYHGGHGGYHGSYYGGGHHYYRPHYSIGFYGGWPVWGWPSYAYAYPAPYYGYSYAQPYYQPPAYD